MAVTIKQIAQAAGVSRGTIDRVLHNRPGVKPEVALHVKQIADELGFSPNKAGKALAAIKQPITIGCFIPSIGNVFFKDVIAGLRLAEKDYSHTGLSIILKEVKGYDVQSHKEGIKSLVDQGCDALCVSTVDVPEMRDCLNKIIESGTPIITVNMDLSETNRLCYVGSDYTKGGCTAAGLLKMMRHSDLKLLIVTGSLKIKGHKERIRGFFKNLKENSTPYKMLNVVETHDNDERAYNEALNNLKAHPEINCIYITAAGAVGVCKAVKDLGLSGKILIFCHDDVVPTKELVKSGMINFTICQEPELQGYKAIQFMYDHFMSNKLSDPEDYITGTIIKIKENINNTTKP